MDRVGDGEAESSQFPNADREGRAEIGSVQPIVAKWLCVFHVLSQVCAMVPALHSPHSPHREHMGYMCWPQLTLPARMRRAAREAWCLGWLRRSPLAEGGGSVRDEGREAERSWQVWDAGRLLALEPRSGRSMWQEIIIWKLDQERP